MTDYAKLYGLQVAPALQAFIDEEALPGSGIDVQTFWSGFSDLVEELVPGNFQTAKPVVLSTFSAEMKGSAAYDRPQAISNVNLTGCACPPDPHIEYWYSHGNSSPKVSAPCGPCLRAIISAA